jgi:hypothetical protein
MGLRLTTNNAQRQKNRNTQPAIEQSHFGMELKATTRTSKQVNAHPRPTRCRHIFPRFSTINRSAAPGYAK